MQIEYRQLFLKDISNIKVLEGSSNRYHIRIGNYCVGIESTGEKIEMMRVLHRREFYRYFP